MISCCDKIKEQISFGVFKSVVYLDYVNILIYRFCNFILFWSISKAGNLLFHSTKQWISLSGICQKHCGMNRIFKIQFFWKKNKSYIFVGKRSQTFFSEKKLSIAQNMSILYYSHFCPKKIKFRMFLCDNAKTNRFVQQSHSATSLGIAACRCKMW